MSDNKFQLVQEINCTDDVIDDIMCTALEGGVNYWCDRVTVVGGKYLGEYASEQISRGGSLMFHVEEPFDNEGTEEYELTKVKFMKGLTMYLSNPMSDILTLEDGQILVDANEVDALVADTIIQLALFGEEIYA